MSITSSYTFLQNCSVESLPTHSVLDGSPWHESQGNTVVAMRLWPGKSTSGMISMPRSRA